MYGNTEAPLTGMINPLESQVVLAIPLSEDYQPPTLEEFEFRTNCGAKMPADAVFCGECGLSESQSRKEALAALLAAESLEQYSIVLGQQGCVEPSTRTLCFSSPHLIRSSLRQPKQKQLER